MVKIRREERDREKKIKIATGNLLDMSPIRKYRLDMKRFQIMKYKLQTLIPIILNTFVNPSLLVNNCYSIFTRFF